MQNRYEVEIRPHLRELLEPTPSGTAKLLAAWDGLALETQIQLLFAKKNIKGPRHLYFRIIEKALCSQNAYVRYLAAKELPFTRDDELKKRLTGRVEEDPDPLVRYAHLETEDLLFLRSGADEPEVFFNLPHDARLAMVRKLTGEGEEVAKLISYAVEHLLKEGKISEIELFEILSDYLNKPSFKERYVEDRLNYDGWSRFRTGKDIEALWELVLNVPESSPLSYLLIKNLPEKAGLSNGIPEHVLSSMSDRQLSDLLDRSDIGLKELRKQKFFEAAEDEEDGKNRVKEFMQISAIAYEFDLSNKEFSDILSMPDKSRVKILKNLSGAMDLRLCLYEAIHDALCVSNVSPSGADYEHAEWAKRSFERKLENLIGDHRRDRELKELRLYKLAVEAVPWNKNRTAYPPSGKLAFLAELVVEGDTWATFVAFSKCWEETYYRTKGLENYLPRIWEAGEEDDFPLDDEESLTLDDDNTDNADRMADRMASRLSDLLATARDESGEADSKIAEALGKQSKHATVAQEELLEAVYSMKVEVNALKGAHGRQHILTWAVLGLLITLLFVKW